VRKLFPLLGLFLLAGCGPSLKISPPVYAEAEQGSTVSISVHGSEPELSQAKILLFPKYQPMQIRELRGKLRLLEPGKFSLSLPALQPDEYRLVVEMPYAIKLAGMTLAHGNKQSISDFVIHQTLPPSCFRFDNKNKDLMGWESHGVFINNRDKPVSKETCPGLFFVNNSWPYALNDSGHGGSLFVPVSSECFPTSSPQTSQPGHWTFTLVSPDLQNRPDWQHLQAIRFHMATRTINISVEPEVQYVVENAHHNTRSDVEARAHYDINGGRWNDFEYDFKLPPNAVVTHVLFHVMGVPEKTVSDQVDSVYLDAVCPVK